MTKVQRLQAYPCSFKGMTTGGLTQEVAAYRILRLRCSHCMSCINNRKLNSGYSSLMLQVLEQVIALFVLCVMVKKSFAFFPPFWIGVYKHMENKCGHIQYSPDCSPGSILHRGISFISVVLLLSFSNPHPPCFVMCEPC